MCQSASGCVCVINRGRKRENKQATVLERRDAGKSSNGERQGCREERRKQVFERAKDFVIG